jgi:urease accessory protein
MTTMTIIIIMIIITATGMTTEAALYRMLLWMSPAYPIGGFSYSHGIEAAVEAKALRDAEDLTDWVETVLLGGAGAIDAALFAMAYRAAEAGEADALTALADRAAVWRGTEELALESSQQGASFLAISNAAWPSPLLTRFTTERGGEAALPVAVAVNAVAHAIPLRVALHGYLTGFVANLVSAGLRAIPLGQTAAQIALARLEPAVSAAVEAGLAVTDLDQVGAAAPGLDLFSITHESQYTRLFRS